jgi:GDPmannose 4,6-dehydratase
LSYPKLRLGNLKAKRDWGHARDYVKAMYSMLQQNESDDYVISSDTTNSIEDFLSIAFNHVGIKDYSDYIYIDPKFYRPAEVDYLCGKSTKAREKLGWKPLMSLNDLVVDMLNE